MKLFVATLLFVSGSFSALASNPPCGSMPYVKFTASAEWNNFRPNCLYYQRAGVPDWNAVGFNVGLRRMLMRNRPSWGMQPKLGFTYGAMTFNNLAENVELPSQQTGNYNARSDRGSVFAGLQFSKQFGISRRFAIEIPVYGAVRSIGHKGYFVDDGNLIVQGDLEGNDTFNRNFARQTQFGFKSGAEFVLFPNSQFSFYGRFNFTYFARADVYDVAGTELNPSSGNVEVPMESVKATGNYGWALGLRFNIIGVSCRN